MIMALAIPAVLFLFLTVWVWALVDSLRNEREYLWVVLLVFVPPLGLPAYAVNFLLLGDNERGLGAARRRSAHRERIRMLREDEELRDIPANREELARLLHEEEDFEEALGELKPLLDSDPENVPAQYLAACSLLSLDRLEAALPHLAYVFEESPAHDGGLAALRYALLLEKLGQPEEALSVYAKAVKRLAPVETRYHYARLLAGHGQRGRSREILEDIVRNEEHTPQFRAHLDEKWVQSARKLLRRVEEEEGG